MKLLLTALLVPGLVGAAILPEKIGTYDRGAISKPALADRPVWDENGLKNSETALYQSGKQKFTATVWQLQDSTGALAAYDWQRPADAKPAAAGKYAVETKTSLVLLHGNYLLAFDGYKPVKDELDAVLGALNNVDTTSLPVLTGNLPGNDRVPNSERYVIGPAGLAKFVPGIPPSVAGFRMGAEAQTAVFRNPKGDMTLAIFSYPTPHIAMDRNDEFQKLPGAVVKRSGPLVAVTLSPPDPDFAERVLGQVRYQAEVTRDEYVPTRRDNIGELLSNIFVLTGLLLLFAIVSGLAVGALKAFRRRGKPGQEADAMITLHLENR